jgi:hypothetical protein
MKYACQREGGEESTEAEPAPSWTASAVTLPAADMEPTVEPTSRGIPPSLDRVCGDCIGDAP